MSAPFNDFNHTLIFNSNGRFERARGARVDGDFALEGRGFVEGAAAVWYEGNFTLKGGGFGKEAPGVGKEGDGAFEELFE